MTQQQNEPKPLIRLVIKEELVKLTGSIDGALILQQFLYWGERTKDASKLIAEERKRGAMEEQEDFTFASGWIYKSAIELRDELLQMSSESTIKRRIRELIDAEFIYTRKNPKDKWDKTDQYRLNLINIQTRLQEMGYALENYPLLPLKSPIRQNDASKIQNDDSKIQDDASNKQDDGAIPEITTEITTEIKQDDDDITRVPQFSESYYPEDHLQEIEEQKKRIEEAQAQEEPRTPLNDMFKAWDENMKVPIRAHHAANLVDFLQKKGMEEIAIVEAIERAKDADYPARVLFKILDTWHREGGRTLAQCLQTPSEIKYREQQEAKILREQLQELKQASGTSYTGGKKMDMVTQVMNGNASIADFLRPQPTRVNVN